MEPRDIPWPVVEQLMTVFDQTDDLTEDHARSVIASLFNNRLAPREWWEIKPADLNLTQCPECFAVILKTSVEQHESWHSQQTDQWRRDHL